MFNFALFYLACGFRKDAPEVDIDEITVEINLLSSIQEELAQLKELLNGAYEIQPGIVLNRVKIGRPNGKSGQ